MSEDYWQLVQGVAEAHLDEIEADLRLALNDLQQGRSSVQELERRVQSLQTLVALASPQQAGPTSSAQMTLHQAMAEVLDSAPEQMMRAGDLAAEIRRRRLYTMRDGRPVEPQQIHARVGHYPDLFEKVGTFIKLRTQG